MMYTSMFPLNVAVISQPSGYVPDWGALGETFRLWIAQLLPFRSGELADCVALLSAAVIAYGVLSWIRGR